MKWLDRELRNHDLKVLADEKARDARMWFGLYQQKCAEIEALKRQIASKDQRIAEAVQEAERLRAELDKYERATPNA